jgi:hypothetical protein
MTSLLSPNELLQIKKIRTAIKLNRNKNLIIVGVNSSELGDAFQDFFKSEIELEICREFQTASLLSDILEKDLKNYFLIDLYSRDFSGKEKEEIAQDLLFNRDYIPEKNLKLILVVEESFLNYLKNKIADFISFSKATYSFNYQKIEIGEIDTSELDEKIV